MADEAGEAGGDEAGTRGWLGAGVRGEHEAAGVLAVAEGAELDVFRRQTGEFDRVVTVAGSTNVVTSARLS
ncbi:MAG: hypothetical protein ACRDOI_44510 [Trebonia sp.]